MKEWIKIDGSYYRKSSVSIVTENGLMYVNGRCYIVPHRSLNRVLKELGILI